MLYVNMCSALVSLFGLLSSGTLMAALEFVGRHPECLMDMTLLSVCATLGQLIILYTIREFGALLFATIMTTRQFMRCDHVASHCCTKLVVENRWFSDACPRWDQGRRHDGNMTVSGR